MAVPVGGRASAALLYCARKVGWTWIGLVKLATPLNVLAYASLGLSCLLPAFNTFWRAWEMNAVAGGTRGEPFVASLVSCACSLLLTLKNNKSWDFDKLVADESVWVNGISLLVCTTYLILFLLYADGNARWRTLLVWIPIGFVYLISTAVVGALSESTDAVEWSCTVSVWASWCIPLLLAVFVMEKDVANLPDYASSLVGLVYCIAWFGRAYPKDYHGLGQNLVGAACSSTFIYLKLSWPPHGEEDQGDLEQLLLPVVPNPPLVLPVVLDPPPLLPVVLDPPPMLPAAVVEHHPELPAAVVEHQPELPAEPQPQVPADPLPVPAAAFVQPQPHLPAAAVEHQPEAVIEPQPQHPAAQPQLPADPPPMLPAAVVEHQPDLPAESQPQVPADPPPVPAAAFVQPQPHLPVAAFVEHQPHLPAAAVEHQPEVPAAVIDPQPQHPAAQPQLPADPPPEPVDPEPGAN